MKEQIEEMTFILNNCCDDVPNDVCENTPCNRCRAKCLYNEGYRRQSEGEWLIPASGEPWKGNSFGLCSRCGKVDNGFIKKAHNFCPNCGAHMKGGAE